MNCALSGRKILEKITGRRRPVSSQGHASGRKKRSEKGTEGALPVWRDLAYPGDLRLAYFTCWHASWYRFPEEKEKLSFFCPGESGAVFPSKSLSWTSVWDAVFFFHGNRYYLSSWWQYDSFRCGDLPPFAIEIEGSFLGLSLSFAYGCRSYQRGGGTSEGSVPWDPHDSACQHFRG